VVAHPREQSDSRSARRLNEPRAAAVGAGDDGVPLRVGGVEVVGVREEWRVVDRWWTDEPVRRRYFELLLQTGRNAVVFRDEERGGWFTQSA
jgi:hypothetical protein